MRLRFIGQDGSMGLKFGQIYRLTIEPWNNGVRITAPIVCPYDTEDGFWRNWVHPDVELRTVMESRGANLREKHLPRHRSEMVPDDDHSEHIHMAPKDVGSIVDAPGHD